MISLKSCWRATVTTLILFLPFTGSLQHLKADTPRLPSTGPIRTVQRQAVSPTRVTERVFSSAPIIQPPRIQEAEPLEAPVAVPTPPEANTSAVVAIPDAIVPPRVQSAPTDTFAPTRLQPYDVYDELLYVPPTEYVTYTCDEYDHRWIQFESVFMWTQGVELPAMATTSPQGTDGLNAGILGQPSTSLVTGQSEIFDWMHSGVRIRGGQWDQNDDGTGWIADVMFLGNREFNFQQTSDGNPIIARPFNNLANGGQADSQLVAFPGLSRGNLSVNAETRLYSMGLSYWTEFLIDHCSKCDDCQNYHWQCNDSRMWGLKIGPRFTHLDDTFLATESLTGLSSGTQFDLVDSFKSETSFLGGEIGVRMRESWGALSVDLGLNIALGANRQEVDIAGSGSVTPLNGPVISANNGFFAQPTNIGDYDRTKFSVQPSLEVALGYETDTDWKITVAYNLLYWTNVVRATEHIDSNLNPDFFPPSIAGNGATGPRFQWDESDYLAHGFSVGLEKRW